MACLLLRFLAFSSSEKSSLSLALDSSLSLGTGGFLLFTALILFLHLILILSFSLSLSDEHSLSLSADELSNSLASDSSLSLNRISFHDLPIDDNPADVVADLLLVVAGRPRLLTGHGKLQLE